MAASPSPLVWDFWREAGTGSAVGGVLDYYDTGAQSIVMSKPEEGSAAGTALISSKTSLDHGNWEDAEWSDPETLDSTPYNYLAFNHPARGQWYGAAVLPADAGPSGSGYDTDTFWLLSYRYILDLEPYVMDGSYKAQADNPVTQISLTLCNVGEEFYLGDGTMFVPGAKVDLLISAGDLTPVQLCVMYIDDISFDMLSDSVQISGRNTIGYVLGTQTFDEDVELEGTLGEVTAAVLEYFGVEDYEVEEDDTSVTFSFKKGSTGLDALRTIAETMTQFDSAAITTLWKYDETPEGKIVCGYEPFVASFLPNTVFRFDLMHEAFKYTVSRNADGAYKRVRMSGTDADGEPLEDEIANIPASSKWKIGNHKTYHADVSGVTQAELARMAHNNALLLADAGETASVTMNLHPALLIGDYAKAQKPDGTEKIVGIVTEITHTFGKSGFFTDFTADKAGGVWTYPDRVATRSISINGSARKTRMLDVIKEANQK